MQQNLSSLMCLSYRKDQYQYEFGRLSIQPGISLTEVFIVITLIVTTCTYMFIIKSFLAAVIITTGANVI